MKKVLIRRIKIRKSRLPAAVEGQSGIRLGNNEIMQKFSPAILDLGDISAPCKEIEAMAAIFDLSGFTKFCNQVDSYLAIPHFLKGFLEWFFDNIRKGLTETRKGGQTYLWAELPVMVKFLGDGLLLLWNARAMTDSQVCRIAAILYDVCYAYRHGFYPEMCLTVNKPPPVLRCGVARGKVFSVGNGKDYVGHCINSASRLSHLGSLSFCFPHHGFQVREHMPVEYARLFTPKYVTIRGVGEDELVWVVEEEFARLRERDKSLFRDMENVFV
jgi:class 3 adenylate cyclase